MKKQGSLGFVLLAAAIATSQSGACSASSGDDSTSSGSNQPSGSSSGGGGSGGTGGAPAGTTSTGSFGEGGLFSTGTGTLPDPEVCDGIDNDGDGRIDNVDVGQDGVCDCLRIATLGQVGTAGTGNVFATWINDRSDNGAADLGSAVLTSQLLAQYQVIVAQDLRGRAYSSDEVAALQGWIQSGGGLITLIGYADPSERTNVNTLLASLGASYGPEPILPAGSGGTIPITEWVDHPTTQGVSMIGFDNGYPVNGEAGAIAMRDGLVVARAKEIGTGHLFVWGDEWITFDSEWQGRPEYQVEAFWLNLIKWLTRETECQVDSPL